MKPFISNHRLFHPHQKFLRLIHNTQLPLLDSLSGQSLKFLRSQIQTLCFNVHDAELNEIKEKLNNQNLIKEAIQSDASWTNAKDAAIEVSIGKMIKITITNDTETRLMIFSMKSKPKISCSIDNLYYNWQSKSWQGGAIDDYHTGVLRIIEPATGEFSMSTALEVAVLAARLDFTPDEATFAKMRSVSKAAQPDPIPKSELRRQFERLVMAAKPSQGFIVLYETGLLSIFLPELAAGYGVTQNRYHRHDVFHHCIYSCDAIEKRELHLRLAGLLHDIGKVFTRRQSSSLREPTFHGHEVVGAKLSGKILFRLGFEKELIERVRFLVREHMFHYTNHWTDKTVRRFINRVSTDQLNDLIHVRMADRKGNDKTNILPPQLHQFLHHVEKIRKEEQELQVRDLAIGGQDLMALGVPPGPIYKQVLNTLLVRVKQGILPNTAGSLLPAAQQILEKSEASSG